PRPSPPSPLAATASRRSVQQQPVQSHGLRRNGFHLKQRKPPLAGFPPAVNPRLALHHLASMQIPQKFPRIRNRRCLPITRPRHSLHGITPQQFAPVMFKQLPRRENVAPCHVTPISHHYANNALALKSGGGPVKPPFQFFDESVDRSPEAASFIYFGVSLSGRRAVDGGLNGLGSDAWRG